MLTLGTGVGGGIVVEDTLRDPLRIDFASLGGDAGYIGAAGLARRESKGQRSESREQRAESPSDLRSPTSDL